MNGEKNDKLEQEHSHVHFNSEEVSTHESQIQVVQLEGGIIEVHLGFLKIHHVYDITFPLTHSLGKDVTFSALENLMVKVKEMTPTEDGHNLTVEFKANKEKLMKEKVTLRNASTDEVRYVIFHARVLGKHKGTPSLRNGIHCVRIEPDEDEESDWVGF